MSDYKDEVTKHSERLKVQFEDTNQASVPESDTTEILELSAWEFKISIIKKLRAQMDKVEYARRAGQCKQRVGNSPRDQNDLKGSKTL